MSSANYLFNLTSIVSFLRCQAVNSSLTELLLQNLSLAFATELNSKFIKAEVLQELITKYKSNGKYLYNVLKSNSNLNKTSGFTNDQWSILESLIEGNTQLKVGVSSLIYCFSVYSNIENKYKEYYINKLCSYIYNEKPPKYFSVQEIESLSNSFSIIPINLEIDASEGKALSRIINYNYYDSSPLFANLETDFKLKQIIKDSENQYYYISGKIFYTPSVEFYECEKKEIVINTPTGDLVSTVYKNFPCLDQDSFVGPVSGVEFVRFFNDGPPSSGYFESDVMEAYKKFDENISAKKDYYSNNEVLYSFTKDPSGNYVFLKSGIQTDAQGAFSSIGEYGYYHTNFIYSDKGCEWEKKELESLPLMRMHQGDNLQKYYYYKILIKDVGCVTGASGPFDWTGFKFVNFKLNDSWLSHFNYTTINPRESDKTRILKRSLNIENHYVYDDEIKIIYSPYLNVIEQENENKTLFCYNYVGYPQLNPNHSSLPGFAFYQTFDNKNFGTGNSEEFSTISIHPAISSGLFSEINSGSNRTIKASNFPIFSGKRPFHEKKSKLPINTVISSNSIGNYDEIFKKTLAIGDNFDNQVSGESSLQSNAGYSYTGYKLFKNGQIINLSSLIDEYQDKKIGAEYSKIKFITGYLNKETNQIYSVVPLTAHIISGNNEEPKKHGEYIVYYYFNTDTGEGSIYSVNTGWTENFAPIPIGIDNKYSGLYGYQKIENYFPRYWSGPYATYESKFLYPNAKYIYEKYNSFKNGFPYKVSYKINIREETVREFFLTSGFDSLKYEKIVRPVVSNFSSYLTGLETSMTIPFVPDTLNQGIKNKYDFYKNKDLYPFPSGMNSYEFYYYGSLDQDYADSYYVPDYNYWLNDNLNSEKYRFYSFDPDIKAPFINGIRIKNKEKIKKIKIKKNNVSVDSTGIFFPPAIEGLYWGYKGTKITGEMLYCSPLFDLSSLTKNPTEELYKQFYYPITSDNNSIKPQPSVYGLFNSPVYSYNGLVDDVSFSPYEGIDPIFGEPVGGRIGEGAELEGGYHSKGIIGDSWFSFHRELLGVKFFGKFASRGPMNDLNLFLLSLNSGNLDIHTRGLLYYPFYHDLDYKPFTSSNLANIGIETKPIKIKDFNYYFNFDLKTIFPLKQTENQDGENYFSTGFNIGPFDRDVELCVLKGNYVLPSGNLIIDNTFIAGSQIQFPCKNIVTPSDFTSYCVNNYLNYFPLTSGIFPGGADGRNQNLTTFKLVPSGRSVNINISGNGKIGFNKEAIVTIRPRTFLKETFLNNDIRLYYTNLFSGDTSYLYPYNFIGNKTEQKFSFSHDGNFKNLIGKKIEYTTKPKIDLLFPVPDSSDFEQILNSKGFITYDSLNNKSYKGIKGPTYDYWKIKNPNIQISGIREVSRISIEIESIDLEYGHSPYQNQKIIIPSGSCRISGIFAYTGQAESSILSQGLFLTGVVRPSSLEPYYSPHYVSDTLKRLPSGIELLPSGIDQYVVLDAPSYAKKRKNYFDLDVVNSEYENYSPEGYNYNQFIWPALSDFTELNPSVAYEQLLPGDDNVFSGSYIFFSASQGQILFSGESGLINPNENATYKTKYLYAFIDSTATNSSYNTGKCIIKAKGKIDTLDISNLSGILTSDGVTFGLIKNFNSL